MDKNAKVYMAAKEKIVPSPELKRAIHARAEEIRAAVERECRKANLSAEVRLDGSVAKDTWIRDYADVDIFMRVSPEFTKEQLRTVCLPLAARALKPHHVTERFAEHPYVESIVQFGKGSRLRVNVVPCYNVKKGHWLSATDRSPYHTEYIRQHLTGPQRDEARLLKAFVRGIGSYGADIKTGGFSGMLCETLVVSYGEFQEVVGDFSRWREERYIDVEDYYEGRADEVHRIFREPLVVIDPVDKGRNLGAAVRPEQLWNFVAASRYLVARPSPSLFAEPKIKPLARTECRKLIKFRGTALLCLVVGKIDAVVDIIWSQLYRTRRALVNLLETNDFKVIRSTAWGDEKSLNLILLELEREKLPSSKRQEGPPVSGLHESASFLAKHVKDPRTISGPWIEGGRWIVQKRREVVSARKLLASALKSGGADVGVASLPARSFRKTVLILENEEIGNLVARNEDFAKAMRTYLSGRPAWLG